MKGGMRKSAEQMDLERRASKQRRRKSKNFSEPGFSIIDFKKERGDMRRLANRVEMTMAILGELGEERFNALYAYLKDSNEHVYFANAGWIMYRKLMRRAG